MAKRIDPRDQLTLKNITEHGWSGIIIEADDEGPGFEYTVGLMATDHHPEVIVFGLPRDRAHELLWSIVHGIREGKRFDREGRYTHILDNVSCICRPVHASQQAWYLGQAMWHCSHVGKPGTLKAVQCVWPDRNGLFPHEDGCHPKVGSLQPDLSEVRSDQPE
jgi:hypothetical protein